MCLMKPNYDVVEHLEYQRKIMVKWLEQITEWTDLNTDIMTDDAYLQLMDDYKKNYEYFSDSGFILYLMNEHQPVEEIFEETFEYFEDLYNHLKSAKEYKDDDDFKPINYNYEIKSFCFNID